MTGVTSLCWDGTERGIAPIEQGLQPCSVGGRDASRLCLDRPEAVGEGRSRPGSGTCTVCFVCDDLRGLQELCLWRHHASPPASEQAHGEVCVCGASEAQRERNLLGRAEGRVCESSGGCWSDDSGQMCITTGEKHLPMYPVHGRLQACTQSWL